MADVLTFKKSNCKNCYKCIRHCPVKSIRFSGNQAHIVGDECILCGQCLVVCPQGAKHVADGVEKVQVLLQSGADVYVSLAPSFVANYKGIGLGGMEKALRALGFAGCEETARGAAFVTAEYERLLRDPDRKVLISSCCHSVNLLIQKYYPYALSYLAPVASPMQAHARDLKDRHPDAKVVFIGPCVAKKDEGEHYGDVDAVLTFEEFSAWLSKEGVPLEPAEDHSPAGKERLYPTTGGVLQTLHERSPEVTYFAVDGIQRCKEVLEELKDGDSMGRCFIEMSACVGSCLGGPLMEQKQETHVSDYMAVVRAAGNSSFDRQTAVDLKKRLSFYDRHFVKPSETEIAAALRQMGKLRPEDELNCGSCGYSTCREKAVAIIQGKAEASMCLPFLMKKTENFSDNIINNSPNAILVLNDSLEVQQINQSALKLMNLPRAADVMGAPVVRLLDPKVFVDVLNTGRNVKDQRVYLAEYNRYAEQTVILDKEYHLLICLMRDITEEETAREQKDKMSAQTIEVADKVVEKQMRIVQEIASLLGETAAETKIALTKLKESITDE